MLLLKGGIPPVREHEMPLKIKSDISLLSHTEAMALQQQTFPLDCVMQEGISFLIGDISPSFTRKRECLFLMQCIPPLLSPSRGDCLFPKVAAMAQAFHF